MSDKGSSTPARSEEADEVDTQTPEEITEEAGEVNTQTQDEIVEEADEDQTQTQEETGEESSEGNNTREENDEAEAQGNAQNHSQGVAQEINEDDDVDVKKLTEDSARQIFEQFKNGNKSKIILIGATGTGKTWMAKEICKVALENKCDEPIWISLDKKHDKKSFVDTVARQFCLPTSADEREEDFDENQKGKDKKVDILKNLHEKMIDKLNEPDEFVLLVLDGQLEMDDEPEMMHEDQNEKKKKKIEDFIKEDILGLKDKTADVKKLKFLITRRKSGDGDKDVGAMKLKLEPLSGDDASRLFRKHAHIKVRLENYLMVLKALEQKSWRPAEILMLAGTLNYFAKDNDRELKPALEAAAGGLPQLLRFAYDRDPGNSMIDCFWHSWNFLRKHGGVNYNELITSWIMEGCLKRTNRIDKAYVEGHAVLMKLIEYNMLKMQEDNIIVLEGATLEMEEYCRRGYWGTGDPGLASVLKGIDPTCHEDIPRANVLDGITPADGMMRTLCGHKKENMMSSLLMDGSRLCREVHEAFFGIKESLNLLAIFSPRLKSPDELSISNPEKLLVLMLRGSYLLEDVNIVEKLTALTVLEISGSRDCKVLLPKDFFLVVSQLRSLDFSGTGIESLPDSFSELTELRRLILRDCSNLEELPKLGNFKKLEIIDLSGCKKFKKIQEKSFRSLEKLKVINFSHTQIEKLPIVKTLTNLSIILLKGCSALSGMRLLKEVKSIKVLDLSGATNIKEVMYDCFEGATNLRELDLSETRIQYLPPAIGDLQKLRLKKCDLLRNLPALSGHSRLEELDLSVISKTLKYYPKAVA
ncbi:hypothetical protein V6N11_057545 [Hibiscus sabdariffa]|uniref:Uncharacterized protein n=2 Tax=Hibiscus sabdariffa TaxID=183260 RepID=A0ABR2NGY3_9ROSI